MLASKCQISSTNLYCMGVFVLMSVNISVSTGPFFRSSLSMKQTKHVRRRIGEKSGSGMGMGGGKTSGGEKGGSGGGMGMGGGGGGKRS